MNKGELVDAIATKKEADAVLTATLDTTVESIAAGEKVTLLLKGLRNFCCRQQGL